MSEKTTGLDRREFLAATGFGLAALTFAGMGGLLTENVDVATAEELPLSRIDTDILVIGGGYAGAFAAVEAKKAGLNVVLVDKGTVGRSGQTPWANGFNVFDEAAGDNREEMIAGASISSEYINNLDWLELQFEDSKLRWDDMTEWGFQDPSLRHPHLALRDKLVEDNVRLVERTMLTELLTQNGTVVGAIGFSLDSEETIAVVAKATIMCAGAGSFKASGFPIQGLTSDGDAMAYRAGSVISGKEFVDFHSATLETPADCYGQWQGMWEAGVSQTHGASGGGMLMSEAFAAHAGTSTTGDMPDGMAPGGDSSDMAAAGGRPEGGPPSDGDSSDMAAAGGRPEGDPPSDGGSGEGSRPGQGRGVQVSGAATGLGIHKAEGVWPTDMTGASNVPGLWAAGDGLASMLCGASYAGVGLSSSGSAVQGARAGAGAAAYAVNASAPTVSDSALEEIRTAVLAPRSLESGYSPAWVTQLLQNTMFPYYVLMVKKADRLEAALTQIMFLQEHMVPLLMASDTHELKLAHETRNMLLNAEMKLRASLYRTESRGTHYREEYPARNDAEWLAWVLIQQDENGNMALSKEMVPEKWRPDMTVDYQTRYASRFPGELAFLGLE
ncbi:MAG: FAD-binding protein [Coriobacteriia bacterium]|nr:FAD-binding protein [Coriobacteriia bacterium]